MSETPPVIIIRGNDICYLGILRSCYEANIPCIAVHYSWEGASTWYSDASKYKPPIISIPNPFSDPKLAIEILRTELRALSMKWGQKLLVLPSTDTNYMFVLDYYEYLKDFIFLMGARDFGKPRYDVVHKAECADLLSEFMPENVPITFRCNSLEQIDKVINEMVYPAVYKPAVKDYGQTFYRLHDGNKAIECEDATTLRKQLKVEVKRGFDLIVQEKIIFDSVYDEIPFYLYANELGDITMAANGIKEIIEPFPYGTAIALRLAWRPDLLELAKRVVSALSYRGILMIEFVKDQKDGRWKIIEINPRHWLFNGFYQRVGLNFSEALYHDIYYSNPDGEPIRISTDKTMKENHVHVDLAELISHFKAKCPTEYDVMKFLGDLKKIRGRMSSTYLSMADPDPGIIQMRDAAKKHGWVELIDIKGKNVSNRF